MRHKAYSEYKSTGIEWPSEIPLLWNMTKLRYVFSFAKGLTITKEHLQDEGVPCVNYGEVHSKYGFEVDPKVHALKYVNEKYLKSNAESLLSKGDLIFADTSEDLDGAGNFTQLITDDTVFAGYHTIIARPLDGMYNRFYAYLLDSEELRWQIKNTVKGVKVFSITQEILRNISIWLPSEVEQFRISEYLDYETAKIDRLINKQEQLIELLKEKRKSVISEVTTVRSDEKALKLSYCVDILPGYAFPSSGYRFEKATNIRLLRGVNVGVDSVRWADVVYWDVSDEIELSAFELRENDIVIGMDRPWISAGARVAEITKEDLPCLLLQRVARVRVNNDYYQPFIKMCLSSYEFKAFIESDLTGVSVPHLSPEQIKSFKIRNINMEQQKEETDKAVYLCNKLTEIENKAYLVIKYLKERRSALISAAVTGKIDLRHWEPNAKDAA